MTTPQDPAAPTRTRGIRMPRPARQVNPEGRMSLIDHIRELRNRLLKALFGLGLGMVVGWIFFNPVWHFIERPYCKIPQKNRLLNTHGCTLVVNGPFVGTAVPLFALGGGFAYLAMTRGLHFLLALVPGGAVALITVDTYLGYAMAMLLIFGLAFEVPLVIVMLNAAGVLTHARIKKWRRMMIFGAFAFAAVATPSPDPFSMLLLAVPCVILVELAEVFAWLNDRRRARRPSMYEGLADDELAPIDLAETVDSDTR